MKNKYNFGIAGTHYYISDKKIYTADIAKELQIDLRLVKNIGIDYIFETDEYTSSQMGLKTSRELLEKLDMKAKDLDMLIYSTNVPEKIGWSGSAKISYELGLSPFPSLDIFQGCNSIIAAMDIAAKYFCSDPSINNLLYVTADKSPVRYLPGFSFYTHGAGAILFSRHTQRAVPMSTVFFGDGKFADHLYVVGGINGGIKLCGEAVDPAMKKNAAEMQMEIFKELLEKSAVIMNLAFEKAKCTMDDIQLFIPNNTTKAVPLFLKEKLNIKEEKIFIKNIPVGRHIGAADLIINLHDVMESKSSKDEMIVCLISYAGGFYWGSSIISIR